MSCAPSRLYEASSWFVQIARAMPADWYGEFCDCLPLAGISLTMQLALQVMDRQASWDELGWHAPVLQACSWSPSYRKVAVAWEAYQPSQPGILGSWQGTLLVLSTALEVLWELPHPSREVTWSPCSGVLAYIAARSALHYTILPGREGTASRRHAAQLDALLAEHGRPVGQVTWCLQGACVVAGGDQVTVHWAISDSACVFSVLRQPDSTLWARLSPSGSLVMVTTTRSQPPWQSSMWLLRRGHTQPCRLQFDAGLQHAGMPKQCVCPRVVVFHPSALFVALLVQNELVISSPTGTVYQRFSFPDADSCSFRLGSPALEWDAIGKELRVRRYCKTYLLACTFPCADYTKSAARVEAAALNSFSWCQLAGEAFALSIVAGLVCEALVAVGMLLYWIVTSLHGLL